MRFAVDLPCFGPCADAALLATLAHEAEEAGWDGFFLWDVLRLGDAPVVDPWVALTAVAVQTRRIRFGPMVTPLPRRRPWMVARTSVSLDRLSGGRLILGVGSGSGVEDWDDLGEATSPRERGELLDESLALLTRLWQSHPVTHQGAHYHLREVRFLPPPAQHPRIPIWVAGTWPQRAPFRRAARWDGVVPFKVGMSYDTMLTPQDIQEVVTFITTLRSSAEHPPTSGGPPTDLAFEVAHWGITRGEAQGQEADLIAAYAEAGVTWWRENLSPWRFGWRGQGSWSVEPLRERIRRGPPHP